jgi:hypothetical protein
VQRQLPSRDRIDRSTLTLLLEIEQNIAIDITINESGAPPKPPAPNEHRGSVQGKLVDENGAPIAGARVSLFAKNVRSEAELGEGKTGKQGEYTTHREG